MAEEEPKIIKQESTPRMVWQSLTTTQKALIIASIAFIAYIAINTRLVDNTQTIQKLDPNCPNYTTIQNQKVYAPTCYQNQTIILYKANSKVPNSNVSTTEALICIALLITTFYTLKMTEIKKETLLPISQAITILKKELEQQQKQGILPPNKTPEINNKFHLLRRHFLDREIVEDVWLIGVNLRDKDTEKEDNYIAKIKAKPPFMGYFYGLQHTDTEYQGGEIKDIVYLLSPTTKQYKAIKKSI